MPPRNMNRRSSTLVRQKLQSRSGDKPLRMREACPQNGTSVCPKRGKVGHDLFEVRKIFSNFRGLSPQRDFSFCPKRGKVGHDLFEVRMIFSIFRNIGNITGWVWYIGWVGSVGVRSKDGHRIYIYILYIYICF